MARKFTAGVFFLIVNANLWLCNANDINGFNGCECNIMDACDMLGKPRPNWAQYLPAGVEQYGYVQQVRKLEYLCEDGTFANLYDCNSKISLYTTIRMTGDQLLADSISRPEIDFRKNKKVKQYQQKRGDYKGSSQRELCLQTKAQKSGQKTRVVAKRWVSAKSKSAFKPDSFKVCLPITLKADIHRGHLIASQYGRGDKEKMKATFTYTNVVPQFGRFNSGPWQQCESSLVMWGRNNCAINGEAKNVQMFIVVGAIPSTVFGPSETIFFGKNGFATEQQETNYPVNMPKYLWTAACCTFKYKDDQRTKSTVFLRENDPGATPCNKMNIPSLTNFLSKLTIKGIELFPRSPECSNPNNHIPLQC